jgi:hypothetical protein
MKMAARKLFLVFAILSGLLALQGTVAEPFPREKAKTEITVGLQEEKIFSEPVTARIEAVKFFIRETLRKAQIQQPLLLSLIISSQHHHTSL